MVDVVDIVENVADRGVGASKKDARVEVDGRDADRPDERGVGSADVFRKEADALRGVGAGKELDVGVYRGISSSGGLGSPPVNANLPSAYFPSRAASVGAKEIGPNPSVACGG